MPTTRVNRSNHDTIKASIRACLDAVATRRGRHQSNRVVDIYRIQYEIKGTYGISMRMTQALTWAVLEEQGAAPRHRPSVFATRAIRTIPQA